MLESPGVPLKLLIPVIVVKAGLPLPRAVHWLKLAAVPLTVNFIMGLSETTGFLGAAGFSPLFVQEVITAAVNNTALNNTDNFFIRLCDNNFNGFLYDG